VCGTTETPIGLKTEDLRKKLTAWTTGKVIDEFIQIPGTSDCHHRATISIPKCWNVSVTTFAHAPDSKMFVTKTHTAVTGLNWKDQQKVVALQVTGHWGGADSKAFGNNGHWVLLIDTGKGNDGKEFIVVYDPDVTATTKSREAWSSVSTGIQKTNVAEAKLLKEMVLGEGHDLGALVRYYRPC
jgi:hypothetical protein